MKKIIAVLILVGCIITMTSCFPLSIITTVIDTVYAAMNPDYEAEDCEFSFGKLTLTLTAEFYEIWRDEISVQYQSTSGTMVYIDKYEFMYSDFDSSKDLVWQAENMRSKIAVEAEGDDGIKNITEVVSADGLVFFTYDYSLVATDRYLVAFFMDSANLWAIYFVCSELNYELYLPYFKKWAGSVVIDTSGSVI